MAETPSASGEARASRRTAPAPVSESELESWGAALGRVAVAERLFVALYGPLGAGKSTLVRAACRGAGVEGHVPSPTFTLVNEYATGTGERIAHVDLYRIDTERELLELGWEELVDQDHAMFVEWAERAGDHLPRRRWDIELGFAADPAQRSICITAHEDAPDPPLPPC